MTYEEALKLADAGKPVLYSYNGGSRYMRFNRYGDAVTASAYGSVIATFSRDGITIDARGYEHHVTTRDAINYCIGYVHRIYSDKNKIYVSGQPYAAGMKISYGKEDS